MHLTSRRLKKIRKTDPEFALSTTIHYLQEQACLYITRVHRHEIIPFQSFASTFILSVDQLGPRRKRQTAWSQHEIESVGRTQLNGETER